MCNYLLMWQVCYKLCATALHRGPDHPVWVYSEVTTSWMYIIPYIQYYRSKVWGQSDF